MENNINTEIQSLRLPTLRNDGNFQFHADTIALIIEANPGRLGIAAIFPPYQKAHQHQDEVLKKISASGYTQQIQEADHERDNAYSAISAVIKAMLKHFDPVIREAARKLRVLTKDYGYINQKSYAEQTSAVYNIVQEFRGNYASQTELLTLTKMVDELERANLAIEALMKERVDETAQKNHGNMKDARANTDAAYQAIRKRINSLVEVEGPENYMEFITKLNVVIDRYKTLIAKSHKRKKTATDETAEAAPKIDEATED